MDIQEIKATAKNLIASDNGENVEYARGICEFIADLDGHEDKDHAERAIEIAKELNVSEEYYTQFY